MSLGKRGKRQATPIELSSDREQSNSPSPSPWPSPPRKRLCSASRFTSQQKEKSAPSGPRGSGLASIASLLSSAHGEALRGIQRKRGSTVARPKSKAGSKKAVSDDLFQVARIVFLTCGIKTAPVPTDGSLGPVYVTKKNVSVTPSALVPLMQHGLCIYNKDGFSFTKDDDFEKLDVLFRQHFPNVYAFFDEHSDKVKKAGLSNWLVCTKASGHGQGVVVFSDDTRFPTGDDIVTASQVGKARTNFNEGVLFLATRQPIPSALLRNPAVGVLHRNYEVDAILEDPESELDLGSVEGSCSEAEDSHAGPSTSSTGHISRSSSGRLTLTAGSHCINGDDVVSVSSEDTTEAVPLEPQVVSQSRASSAGEVSNYILGSMTIQASEDPWNNSDI